MREDSVFARKNALMARHRSLVVHIPIQSRQSAEVVDFGDAFRSGEVMLLTICVAESLRPLVWSVRDDVMIDRVQVAHGGDSGRLREPRVRVPRVLLVLGLLHHPVVQSLEGTFLSRWL